MQYVSHYRRDLQENYAKSSLSKPLRTWMRFKLEKLGALYFISRVFAAKWLGIYFIVRKSDSDG